MSATCLASNRASDVASGLESGLESGRDPALCRIESIYREHTMVQDVVAFHDRLGQLVALIVSREPDDSSLRQVLDETARRCPADCPRIVDFVALPPGDPLVPALFTAEGRPRHALVWQFLVGSIDTLTAAGDRVRSSDHLIIRGID
jgi:hypothetical protein